MVKTLLLRPFVDATIGISPPISIMYLSSFLKSKGHDVKLIDNVIDRRMMGELHPRNRYVRNILKIIERDEPNVIGMTLFSRELTDIAALCSIIKNRFKSTYIVLGGPHPTAMPTETIQQIPDCDFVIRGEGEKAFSDLIFNIRRGMQRPVLRCVNGDAIGELEVVPFPDRGSLLANYKSNIYGSLFYGVPSDVIMTSRGCPYNCHFCFKVCSKYRSRSPENVIAEIDWVIKNISPASIQLMDDSFTVERKRTIKILEYMAAKNYPCKFKVRSRVDAVDEELLEKMKKASIDTIVYGFESGAQTMLDLFNKNITIDQSIRACRLTKRAGIRCFGDMILFYPGESRRTINETRRFIKIARPSAVKFYILSPLPGTKVYEDAKRNGTLVSDWLVNKDAPWVKIDGFNGLDEMEAVARQLSVSAAANPSSIILIMQALFKNLLKNPYTVLKLFIYSSIKKFKY